MFRFRQLPTLRLRLLLVGCLATAATLPMLAPAARADELGPPAPVELASEATLNLEIDRGLMGSSQAGQIQADLPFVPVAPRRLVDTRNLGADRLLKPNITYLSHVVGPKTGNADVATAVSLNVTAIDSADAGFVTIWPCDEAEPTTSSLNFGPHQAVPNAVVTRIAGDGSICVKASAAVSILIDTNGWFPVGSYIQPKNPDRLADSRPGGIAANVPFDITVNGRFGVPTTASAALINVTITSPTADGFATVYPCGQAVPEASSINFRRGQTVANLVLAAAGDTGHTCIVSSVTTNVIADVVAWMPSSADIRGQRPERIWDSRPRLTPIGAQQSIHVPLRQTPNGPPLKAKGAVLNVTAVSPQRAGFMTVYTCGQPVPATSNINYPSGGANANLVIATSDAAGDICIYSDAQSDVIVDVDGLFDIGLTTHHTAPWTVATDAALPTANADAFTGNAPAAIISPYAALSAPRGKWGYLTAAQMPKFMGQLTITAAGGTYRCSGTVVAPDIILTAGHCVLDEPLAGETMPRVATKVSFTPGLYGGSGIGQWQTASADDIHPSPGYVYDHRTDTPPVQNLDDTANDWALIRLAPNGSGHVGAPENAGFVRVAPNLGRSPLPKVTLHYPAAGFFSAHCVGGATPSCFPMYCVSDAPPVYATETSGRYVVGDGCPLMNGSSGGGIFSQVGGKWYAVSVVSQGPDRTIDGEPNSGDPSLGAYAVQTIGPELSSPSFNDLMDHI